MKATLGPRAKVLLRARGVLGNDSTGGNYRGCELDHNKGDKGGGSNKAVHLETVTR